MLEVFTNLYILIFLLVTVHAFATKLCSLLSTPLEIFSSPQNLLWGKM